MKIIAFAGSKMAGKDTAARFLLARNSVLKTGLFEHVNFADTLKEVVGAVFGYSHDELYVPELKEVVVDRWPNQAPRTVLQNVANTFRTMYAGDIWVRAWLRKVPKLTADCVLITDLRHIEELEALRELGAKIIFIDNPKIAALRAKGIEVGDPMWTDSSEAFTDALRLEADAIIQNDADLNTLYSRTMHAVQHMFPEWQFWEEPINTNASKKA